VWRVQWARSSANRKTAVALARESLKAESFGKPVFRVPGVFPVVVRLPSPARPLRLHSTSSLPALFLISSVSLPLYSWTSTLGRPVWPTAWWAWCWAT
jgi:hypothetical protein